MDLVIYGAGNIGKYIRRHVIEHLRLSTILNEKVTKSNYNSK